MTLDQSQGRDQGAQVPFAAPDVPAGQGGRRGRDARAGFGLGHEQQTLQEGRTKVECDAFRNRQRLGPIQALVEGVSGQLGDGDGMADRDGGQCGRVVAGNPDRNTFARAEVGCRTPQGLATGLQQVFGAVEHHRRQSRAVAAA